MDTEDEDDNRPLKNYQVCVQIPLTVMFTVEAKDEEDAHDVAAENARDMKFTTYIHAGSAEMLGLADRHGVPVKDARFDCPSNVSEGEIEVMEE